RQGNDAFRFVTDVDQHFTRANFQNTSFDDAAFPEIRHRLRHHILHLHHNKKGLLGARDPAPAGSIFSMQLEHRKTERNSMRFRAIGQDAPKRGCLNGDVVPGAMLGSPESSIYGGINPWEIPGYT